MKVQLRFTGGPTGPFEEEVDGEEMRPGIVELRSHATFAPLGPGDIVETEGPVITGIKHFEPLWTIEATLHLPAGTRFAMSPDVEHPAMVAVAECEEDWRRAAWVTRNTSFSFLISAQTRGWLEDNVEGHPYVEHVALVRTPDLRPDLDVWLTHPSFA